MATRHRISTVALVSVMVVLGLCTAGKAAELTNGDFSSGLLSWQVSDADLVTISNKQAVIRESALDAEVTLFQDFTLSPNQSRLRVVIADLRTEMADLFPDALGISLLDPTTLVSLIPTVDSFTDSYYIRDLVDGVAFGEAALGVSVLPTGDSLPFTVDVNVQGLEGQSARLLIRLVGGGPELQSGVTIDSIRLVPEPSSLALECIAGLISLMSTVRYRAMKPRSRLTRQQSAKAARLVKRLVKPELPTMILTDV